MCRFGNKDPELNYLLNRSEESLFVCPKNQNSVIPEENKGPFANVSTWGANIHIVNTLTSLEIARSVILNDDVLLLAIDCEWRPFGTHLKNKCSLLQIATNSNHIFLFDLMVLQPEWSSRALSCDLDTEIVDEDFKTLCLLFGELISIIFNNSKVAKIGNFYCLNYHDISIM